MMGLEAVILLVWADVWRGLAIVIENDDGRIDGVEGRLSSSQWYYWK